MKLAIALGVAGLLVTCLLLWEGPRWARPAALAGGQKALSQPAATSKESLIGGNVPIRLPMGRFRYVGLHSGEEAVVGELNLSYAEGGDRVGTWELKRNNHTGVDLGPQDGRGILYGGIEVDGSIVLSLSKTADYDVVLSSSFKDGRLRGTWQFRNDAGVVSSGSFTADRIQDGVR